MIRLKKSRRHYVRWKMWVTLLRVFAQTKLRSQNKMTLEGKMK